MSKLKRVGHKGADLIEPGNTYASFDAALRTGVDMIEFDVLPARQSSPELVLAHDFKDAARRHAPSLEEGVAYLASEPFARLEFIVDLKLQGYELRVVDALRESGLLGRVLISTQYRESVAVIRAADPSVRVGWTVPNLAKDPFESLKTAVPAFVLLQALRVALPWMAARAIRRRQCDALMVHWRLVTRALVRAVLGAGGELYVWTVDELPRIKTLSALGVTGVISNDPRLFAAIA
jgi:glycerophosphoryl diester phosphodiesterase